MSEAPALLKKTGDIERLLSRAHSMGGVGGQENTGQEGVAAYHPDKRAVLYETKKHTKRKVGDFLKLLNGLRAAAGIPELFDNVRIRSPMLRKIVKTTDEGGCFPSDMEEKLDWFFENFDLRQAVEGDFEPSRGMDEEYDAACDAIEDVKRELKAYKKEMCSRLWPRNAARSLWTYINTKEDAKDKYLIKLPATFKVPNDLYVKAK
jgi:DNA mismatch repair protein MSH6